MNVVEQWLASQDLSIACPMGARLTPDQCQQQQARALDDPTTRPSCFGCHHSALPGHMTCTIPSESPRGRCLVCGVEVVATRYYCEQHRPGRKAPYRFDLRPAAKTGETMTPEQPTMVEPPVEKRNGRKPPRHFTDDDRRRFVAEYEALPKTGGHRKNYLQEHGFQSSMMAEWRARPRAEQALASPFACPNYDGATDQEAEIAALKARLAAAESALNTEVEDANEVIRQLREERDRLAARGDGQLFARISRVYCDLDRIADEIQGATTKCQVVSIRGTLDKLDKARLAVRKAALHIAALEAQGWTRPEVKVFADEEIPG